MVEAAVQAVQGVAHGTFAGRGAGPSSAGRVPSPVGRGQSGRRVVSPRLVGRDGELSLLVETVLAPPAVAVIEGEAGVGKSRLVAELLAHVDGEGAGARPRVLVGRCHQIREPFPLGPVIEAVRGLGDDESGGSDLPAVTLSPVVGALRPLLPELARWLPPLPEPLDDRVAERHRAFRGLAELLAAVSPVVLVLEDLHWADEQTIDFLGFLTAEQPAGLSVVITYRGDEVAEVVPAVVARLPAATASARIALSGLDVDGTGALARAILDADAVSPEFAGLLHRRTEGVPFAVEEVLALLRQRGDLVHTDGRWIRRELHDLGVPEAIKDSVRERLGRLSAHAQAVVEAAAVLQQAVPIGVVAAVAGGDRGVTSALSEAVESGLLEGRDGRVGFRHVLAAHAVYEAIPDPRRGQLHGRAADALAALEPRPLGQLAHHLKHAGRASDWVRAAEEAADAAAALGHETEAARLLEETLPEAPLDAEQRWRIALKLGRASSESGDSRPDLADLLAGVLEEEMPRAARGELAFWLAMVMQNAGIDTLHRRRLLMEAVADLEDRPDLEAWAMVTLGIALPPGVPVSEHKRWLARALETVPSIGDPVREVFLLGGIAMSLAYVGDPQWRSLADEIVARTGGTPRSRREADAYLRIAMAACYIGAHDRAEPLLAAVTERADTEEHPRTGDELASTAALLDFCRGNWDGLRDRAETLVEELELLERLDVEVVAGCLALAAGDADEARRRLAAVAQELETTGDRSLLAFVTAAAARQAVVSGDVEVAGEITDRFLLSLDAKGLWAPVTRALPAVTQLLAATGQEPRAHTLVARVAEELAGVDAPLALAALAHAHGFLDSAQGHSADAARHFLAAAGEYERLSCPYEAAQAREHAAAALFSTDAAAAERELRAALAAYHALGATWDHARCARAARACGMRLSAPYRGGRKGYGNALSPREEEVAQLAASGHSNKAIAAALFLSEPTVSKHLVNAMRKLDVHSRAAIAGRLLERGLGQPAAQHGGG